MKIFSTDSSLYIFLQRLWDILQVNFMWVLFSLPIVTVGASTAAAFKVCQHMADDREGYVVREFIKEFKENIKQGSVVGLISLVAVYSLYLDLQLFIKADKGQSVFLLVSLLSGLLFSVCIIYAYPLLVRYKNTLGRIMGNAFKIYFRYIGRTIIIMLIVAVEIVLIFFNKTTIFIGILIGPACIIYTIAGMTLRIFTDIEKNEEASY